MTCRCPACDQFLVVEERVTRDTIVCCDRCDRGFHPQDARCGVCAGPIESVARDSFDCTRCGASQLEKSASTAA